MRIATINNKVILPAAAVAGLALVSLAAWGAQRDVRRSEVQTQATVGEAALTDINAAAGLVPPIEIRVDGVPVPIVPNAVTQLKTDTGVATVVNGSSPNASTTVVTSNQPQAAGNANLSITTNQSQSNTSVQTFSNSSNSSFVTSNNSSQVFTTGNGVVNVSH